MLCRKPIQIHKGTHLADISETPCASAIPSKNSFTKASSLCNHSNAVVALCLACVVCVPEMGRVWFNRTVKLYYLVDTTFKYNIASSTL